MAERTGAAARAAQEIDLLIAEAGQRLAEEVRRAAREGELEMRAMAERVAEDMISALLKRVLEASAGAVAQRAGGEGAEAGAAALSLAQAVSRGGRFL